MAFRCPRCGGNVVFDPAIGLMRCEYCDSEFAPEQFDVKDTGRESEPVEEGLKLFTCGNCGAQLQGTEDSMVGFCPYCGGQSILEDRTGRKNSTEYVLPFTITREQCAGLYQANAKKVWYLPREMKESGHLDRLTGIYMPYFEYDVQMGAAYIEGTKTVERHSRYDVVNTYRIDAKVDGDCCSVPYDASRYLDDEIAARILPFDMEEKQPFNAAFLSGYYADVSTVPPETYYQDAEKQASDDMVDEVSEQIYRRERITVDKAASHIDAKTKGYRSALLPLWFVTWRRENRVAYAVINGRTGKVVSDLPVDLKAFFIGCIVMAAVLFAVLETFVQPTPVLTSILSLIASILMMGSISNSTKRIFEKETHANDKGWTQGGVQVDAQVKSKKKVTAKRASTGFIFLVFIVILLVYNVIIPEIRGNASLNIEKYAAAVAVIIAVIAAARIARWQRSVPEKKPILAALLTAISAAVNAAVVFISPVNDAWYYAGDAVCILILIMASVMMMQVYNLSTMRPLPKLFDRSEVG